MSNETACDYHSRLLVEALFPHDAYRPDVEQLCADLGDQLPLNTLVRLLDAVNHCRTRVSAMPLMQTDVIELRRAGLTARVAVA